MEADLSFRAAVVDAFVQRLLRLRPEEMDYLESARTPFDHHYQFALQTAARITRDTGFVDAEAHELLLQARFQAIDSGLGNVERTTGRPHPHARAMAKAAVRALLLRASPSLSSGAFSELYAPFRTLIDLDELEREARLAAPRST